jgi:ornithine cyclodeaminase/alanine dehydrogenase-like protein (mu-crystallin family)
VSVASVPEAVESADVVISMVSFGPDRQSLDPTRLRSDVIFIAVDYDMQAPAALAREAEFIVDERAQFLAARAGGAFAGYPDPHATIGELLRGAGTGTVLGAGAGTGEGAGASRGAGAGASTGAGAALGGEADRASGRILVTHLGVGLADVVFGSAILARAEQLGLGRMLPR